MNLVILIVLAAMGFAMPLQADKKRAPKVQDVSFDGDQVDGVARTPEGFYITQKKAVDFLPLYKVRETFDSNIKESVEYLR
ncbi:MAG: hypothetical protein K2X47_16320 [Bdellovibrionales bacterium]|nr:hypothetical protein [Bdellovibrionales bacterium]